MTPNKAKRAELSNMLLVQIEQMKLTVSKVMELEDANTILIGNHSIAQENAFVVGNHLFGKKGMIIIDTEWLDMWGRS